MATPEELMAAGGDRGVIAAEIMRQRDAISRAMLAQQTGVQAGYGGGAPTQMPAPTQRPALAAPAQPAPVAMPAQAPMPSRSGGNPYANYTPQDLIALGHGDRGAVADLFMAQRNWYPGMPDAPGVPNLTTDSSGSSDTAGGSVGGGPDSSGGAAGGGAVGGGGGAVGGGQGPGGSQPGGGDPNAIGTVTEAPSLAGIPGLGGAPPTFGGFANPDFESGNHGSLATFSNVDFAPPGEPNSNVNFGGYGGQPATPQSLGIDINNPAGNYGPIGPTQTPGPLSQQEIEAINAFASAPEELGEGGAGPDTGSGPAGGPATSGGEGPNGGDDDDDGGDGGDGDGD